MEVDNIMNKVEEEVNKSNQSDDAMSGTLNDPYNDTDKIVKVGTIDDGTKETYIDKKTGKTKEKKGTPIIVVEKTNASGNKYHRVYAEIGFLTPAQASKSYQMTGAMKVKYKYDHQMYATQKEGTSEETGKPYKFISLVLYKNDDIKEDGKEVSDPKVDIPF